MEEKSIDEIIASISNEIDNSAENYIDAIEGGREKLRNLASEYKSSKDEEVKIKLKKLLVRVCSSGIAMKDMLNQFINDTLPKSVIDDLEDSYSKFRHGEGGRVN